MINALATAVAVFVLSFLAATVLAGWWHHWRHADQPPRYRLATVIFALLLALYAFATTLGR